jgi:hypothetical protein
MVGSMLEDPTKELTTPARKRNGAALMINGITTRFPQTKKLWRQSMTARKAGRMSHHDHVKATVPLK